MISTIHWWLNTSFQHWCCDWPFNQYNELWSSQHVKMANHVAQATVFSHRSASRFQRKFEIERSSCVAMMQRTYFSWVNALVRNYLRVLQRYIYIYIYILYIFIYILFLYIYIYLYIIYYLYIYIFIYIYIYINVA